MRKKKTNATDNKKALGYIRVSTEEQAVEGVSLPVQEAKIRSYCQMHDLDLVRIIADEGTSAARKLSQRQGGSELLKVVESGEVGHVIVLKLDRLFRRAGEALSETENWERRDIVLHLVDQKGASISTRNSLGRFFFVMLAGVAEMERGLIAERTVAAMEHRKSQRQAYSPTPYGFDRVGDQLRENAKELATVERIRDLRAEGLSLGKIAARLNREGVPTKNGKKWYGSTVNYILRNSLYRQSA